MSTTNEVTVEQARDALSRFIHSHFRETGKDCARFSIPANRERDDDMILSRFIDQYDALRAAPPKIDGVPTVPGWYWAKWPEHENVRPIRVRMYSHGLLAQPFDSECLFKLDTFTDYHGPLTPPKETT